MPFMFKKESCMSSYEQFIWMLLLGLEPGNKNDGVLTLELLVFIVEAMHRGIILHVEFPLGY